MVTDDAVWTGNERIDGLTIHETAYGSWIVRPKYPHWSEIRICECCGRPMMSAAAAKAVANRIYPIDVQPV